MALAQQPRDARQRLKMIGARAFRREQQKDNVDGCSVNCVEVDRIGKARADAGDALKANEFAMRDGDALAEPGRAQPLTLQQRVEDVTLLQAGEPRRARRQILKQLLLGLDLE